MTIKEQCIHLREKGGTNELSNLGVTIPSANYSKHDLTIEEYLSLCKNTMGIL